MKVFFAILSVFCLGAMMNEKDKNGKMMWLASFITTAIVMLIMTAMQVA